MDLDPEFIAERVDLDEAVQTAVQRAFSSWLNDDTNAVRIEQCIEDGVNKALYEWLDSETPRVHALMAKRLRDT